MNRPRLALSALIVLSMLAIYSCNGSNMVTPPVMGEVPMSLTITDTPPAGVTVLSFEVSVTGATLNPGNVDLLGSKRFRPDRSEEAGDGSSVSQYHQRGSRDVYEPQPDVCQP